MEKSREDLEKSIAYLTEALIEKIQELSKLREGSQSTEKILQRAVWDLTNENTLLKQLVDYGKIHVNVSTSDCDGGHTDSSATFESIEQYEQYCDEMAENAEGSLHINLCKPEDMQERHTYFTR